MAKAQNEIKIIFKGDDKLSSKIKKLDKATKSLINTQVKLESQRKKGRTQAEKNSVALDRLRVKVTALGLNYNKVVVSNKHFGSALMGSKVALEKVKIATQKYIKENTKADISTRILGGTFAVLRSKLLLVGFAMTTIVRPLLRFVKDSARLESVSNAFDTLAGATEISSFAMEKLNIATNNTMSQFELFQQANNAMILGVTKNSDEMAEMFDIAQRLGRALGRDTASSVESLVTGIGRQSRLMLDNIGIIVKADEAYKKFAEANNTTADALTDAQKKQAFLEATMESARQKVSTLGVETLTTQDSLDKFTSSLSNLGSAIGENLGFFSRLGVIFAGYADSLTDALTEDTRYQEVQKELNKELGKQLLLIQETGDFYKQQHVASQERVKVLLEELDALESIAENNKARIESEKKLAEAVRIQGLAEEFNKEMSAGRFSIDKQKFIFDIQYKEGIQGVTNAIELQANKVEELTIKQNENFHSLKFLDAEQKFAVDSVRQLSSAFGQATINGQNMGDAVVSSLKAIASELIAQAGTYALLNMFTGGAFGAGTSFFKFITGHTGGLIKDNGDIQRFATGGMVQGQDNVPIMAQAGEFIIRKAVVEQVGVDTLARLNSGEGGAGNTINVNISGGVVDESYVNNELIPALNKASGLGNRINA